MNTLEHVISVVVLNSTKGNQNSIKLPAGKITHVAAFYPKDYAVSNKGFVRAAITDVNGVEVSKMQSIDNYRDREAGYLEGKKPLNIEGGNFFTVAVQATELFNLDFQVEMVFVYENPIQQNCN